MKSLLIFLISLFAPLSVFADDSQMTDLTHSQGLTLTPSNTDLSLNFLSSIFGVVDGVLHGSGSQVLGAMFSVFNSALLFVGGIIAIYTLIVSTLNTAQEGEVLGKKWSSIWIPLRTALGIALLIPRASGYSTIQIMVMWLVVQGIGAANAVWSATLQYLLSGGVLVTQNIGGNDSSFKSEKLTALAGQILQMNICMLAYHDKLQQQADSNSSDSNNGTTVSTTVIPDFTSTVDAVNFSSPGPDGPNHKPGRKVYFPGKVDSLNGTPYIGRCGAITWYTATPTDNNSNYQSNISPDDYRAAGLQQMIVDLNGSASNVYQNAQLNASDKLPVGQTSDWPPNKASDAKSYKPRVHLLEGDLLGNTASDYQGIMRPYLHQTSSGGSGGGDTSTRGFIVQAMMDGWLMAGRYYWNVTNLNNAAHEASSDTAPTGDDIVPVVKNSGDKFPSTNGVPDDNTCSPDSTDLNSVKVNTADLRCSLYYGGLTVDNAKAVNDLIYDSVGTASTGYIHDATTYAKNMQHGSVADHYNFSSNTNASGITSAILRAILDIVLPGVGSLIGIIQSLPQLTLAQGMNSNPIASLALMGNSILGVVAAMWFFGAATLGAATAVAGVVPCITSSNGFIAFAIWFVPLISALMVALFVLGATMAYYLPLIPFILFLFGTLGWFIGVIEAIIAAPLVALGISHPEGHEAFGKADPAIMLILNVFLRPSLMIFGYVCGIILSYVSLWVLNAGFGPAAAGIFSANSSLAGIILSPVAILIIYVGIIMVLINKSFSLIHIIPDKVIRFIGGQSETLGSEAAGAAEKVQGTFSSGMKAVGGSMAKISGKAGDDAVKRGEYDDFGKNKDQSPGGASSNNANQQSNIHIAKN